jgi:Holliday junction resolvase RusA-like endonuclease
VSVAEFPSVPTINAGEFFEPDKFDRWISFAVPGKPVSWKRTGRNGGARFNRADHTTYLNAVWVAGRNKMSKMSFSPFATPVAVSVEFFFPMPDKVSAGRAREIRQGVALPPEDVDNLGKIILDGMSGTPGRQATVLTNDKVVRNLTLSKRYAIDEPPRADVVVRRYSLAWLAAQ